MPERTVKTTSRTAIVSLTLLALLGSARGEEAREIARKAFPSVVLIVVNDAHGQPLALGSGFFVKPDIVATNYHVIEGASAGFAKVVGAKRKHSIVGVIAADAKRDLALLKLKEVQGPVLAFGDAGKLAVGDRLYVVGNPLGLEGSFSMGILSGIRNIEDRPLLQITAPISPGSSGGPVLNSKCEAVGVAVATYKGGQNLNFAIPSSDVASLLKKSGAPQSLAKAAPKGTSPSALGGRAVEGVTGKAFVWDLVGASTISGDYSFTLRNHLSVNVKNIYCLVVLHDNDGDPVETEIVNYPGVIPAGMAKRVRGEVDGNVKTLTTEKYKKTPHTKIEYRILSFERVE